MIEQGFFNFVTFGPQLSRDTFFKFLHEKFLFYTLVIIEMMILYSQVTNNKGFLSSSKSMRDYN